MLADPDSGMPAAIDTQHLASLAWGWLGHYTAARSGNARVTAAVRLDTCSRS
jgi:hypothetical protein